MARPFDWSQIIRDLEAVGWSQRRIGVACEADHFWVQRLKNIDGTEPFFHRGALLLGLWAQVMGRTTTEAPREIV